MMNYIIPQIIKYQNIDDLLKSNKTRSLFDSGENLSIDELLQENFVCIIGEPGIGKSRLVEEIRNHSSQKKIYHDTASHFEPKSVPKDSEFCVIDALDEVEGYLFFCTLQTIKEYKAEYPDTKVLFTCRKHYVASYKNYFDSCNELIYVELCRLRDEDVMEVVNKCSEITKTSVTNNSKLKELLTIPRYLTFFEEYENQKRDISNISELFEYIISRSILKAIEARHNDSKSENLKILIQRVLEKVAFIMEISRKDQISKDELYTILDGTKGNMAQMLIANFDLLFFESRILKDTNGILQFENTEIQEYLAAKELSRQDNIESILYDVAAQRDLKHIYPNWFDVIPHLSSAEGKMNTFINVVQLIISYESNFENSSFESLLRFVDPSNLSLLQKETLFSLLFEHYLREQAYIMWNNQTLHLIQVCYCSRCNDIMKPQYKQFSKIQLANVSAILEIIVKENKLDSEVSKYWKQAAKFFIQERKEEYELGALNLYKALNDHNNLVRLSRNYNTFSKKVKEKYCEVTGYNRFTNKNVVNCWIEGCYESNPHAINAVLNIENPSILMYAYSKIIEKNKLKNFFNPEGSLFVHYESYLEKQFDIAWNQRVRCQEIMTKVVANCIDDIDSHMNNKSIHSIIKKILLRDRLWPILIACENQKWELLHIFDTFDAEFIDAKLLTALEMFMHESKMENWQIDKVISTLVYKISHDEVKRPYVFNYLTRFSETFERWDKNSKIAKEENPQLIKEYQILITPNAPIGRKYNAVLRLSQNADFLRKHDSKPVIDVIEDFFDNINLNKMYSEKHEDNSFCMSKALFFIPNYAKALYYIRNCALLKKYRIFLAKTLPIIHCTAGVNVNEIKDIYKSIIGKINDQEKAELVAWWKSRKDDYINISSNSIFTCIVEYGFDALSYKLEEYIEEYVNHQDQDHYFAASKALKLLSDGYLDWNFEKYKALFDKLKDDSIESLKMQCNAIMIEKFQDLDSIRWRIEYLRNHVVKSIYKDTRHARFISIEESEIINNNPSMFRCFMNIKNNEKLIEQMLGLFDVGLSLCNNFDTQEYASYILKQIYNFFLNTDNGYISELRKKVEAFNTKNVSFFANDIMNNAEMMFLKKEKISIDKAIKMYNKCIVESHLEIRNDGDLRRYFTYIHSEVQKEIQDQGIYSLISQDVLSEDFIQRELKNTIINKCCKLGLNAIQVDREVALQDNKRTDLLIRYGFCNPIMVELKLLHNDEIQNERKRHEYKKKFIKYKNATNACLSVFWVFNVHKDRSDTTKFKNLEEEYKDLNNTRVLLTDCKCSSGIDTGISNNN